MERSLIISSDGHAMALMEDYRPYVPADLREEFDEFLKLYDARGRGRRTFDLSTLSYRCDPEVVGQWMGEVFDRLDGNHNPERRLVELEREGIVGEVIFPDFGLPFELLPPSQLLLPENAGLPRRTPEQMRAGAWIHNRWLADFISVAPGRFAAIAAVDWNDADYAVQELAWVRNAGMRGVLLPAFSSAEPMFHPRFDRVWDAIEDLGLVVNSHILMSTTLKELPMVMAAPHPASTIAVNAPINTFFSQQTLTHLIWGGVLEKHPRLRVAFTELGSGWIPGALSAMDYSYDGSYLRQDHRSVLKSKPSEYFRRQCFLGSSTFSQAEIAARHHIGLDKMMLGMDYPHHEGTLAAGGTTQYLRATLGAEGVPADEARMLLGGTAMTVWDFDESELRAVADRVGPPLDEILTPPTEDLFPRGDVHKPLGALIL
jgi:predicted TIM-barrel fold metal-dependent hydrolase